MRSAKYIVCYNLCIVYGALLPKRNDDQIFELIMLENLMVAKDPHVFVHILCLKKKTSGDELQHCYSFAI